MFAAVYTACMRSLLVLFTSKIISLAPWRRPHQLLCAQSTALLSLSAINILDCNCTIVLARLAAANMLYSKAAYLSRERTTDLTFSRLRST